MKVNLPFGQPGLILALFLVLLPSSDRSGRAATPAPAPAPAWYAESQVHTHHSTGQPAPEWKQQLDAVRPDAVQFHTPAYRDGQSLARQQGFAFVCTLSLSGGWDDVGRILRTLPARELARFSPRLNSDGTPTGRMRGGKLWQHLCLHSPGIDTHLIPIYAETTRQLHPHQFWIDHTVVTVNLCYCDFCRRGFAEAHGSPPPVRAGETLWQEWVDYHRQAFARWMKKTRDAVKAVDPNTIVTFNGAYLLSQPEAPPDFVENLSMDVHSQPMLLDLYARYATTLGLPFDLMTGLTDRWAGKIPKTAREVLQAAAIVTAHGGRWNIGEFPASRETQPADAMLELAAAGASLVRARQEWTRQTESVPLVAVLHSASTQYARVIPRLEPVSSESGELAPSDSGRIEYQRKDGPGRTRIYWYGDQPCPVEVTGAGEALLENNIHFDVINETTLKKRLQEYKVLIVPDQFRLDAETVEKIRVFVAAGGGLLASGRTIESQLAPLLGVTPRSGASMISAELECGGSLIAIGNAWTIDTPSASMVQPFHGRPSQPAVTKRSFGRGTAHYLAGDFFRAYYEASPYTSWLKARPGNPEMRAFFAKLFSETASHLGYACAAPPWCEVVLRRRGADLLVQLIDRSFEWPQRMGKEEPIIKLDLTMAARPDRVVLQPGAHALDWQWRAGSLLLSVPMAMVQTHAIIEIKGAAH